MTDGSPDSEGSDASSEDESPQPITELMITNRERRKTAGNRYSQVVSQEQAEEDAEDDVALLFAEAEGEDEEYNSDEADDEADMSSSDDDDQGPDAGAEEFEGEQEIQKQAKVERSKKRKADMALTTMSAIRKKPKIDPTTLHRAPDKPKPSKRKERVSWLPDNEGAPGRTSLRKQTVAHREVMLERLKENEELRLKNKAQREKKDKIKQAEAPQKLTQADRLIEAARNERKNAKSLNRWEAREKERAEEQAARLAALKDRTLDGAVLTTYSTAHLYQGPRLEHGSPGPSGTDEVPQKRKYQRKPKFPFVPPVTISPSPVVVTAQPTGNLAVSTVPPPPWNVDPSVAPIQQSKDSREDTNWLAGIHEYASLQSAPGSQDSPQLGKQSAQVQTAAELPGATIENVDDVPSTNVPDDRLRDAMGTNLDATAHPAVVDIGNAEQDGREQGTLDTADTRMTDPPKSSAAQITREAPIHVLESLPAASVGTELHTAEGTAGTTTEANEKPVIEILSTRNLVILDRFEELPTEDYRDFSVLLNAKKSGKLPKAVTEYCSITGQIARYRDPASGVSYANKTAYKRLKEAQKYQFGWSSMLGCYTGRVGHAARGVPDGFLG